MKKVIIGPDALMTLILSSIEVYSRETFGILLGTERGSVCKVMRAVPYLTAQRDYEYTSIDATREKRINSIIAFLTTHKVIGDYHSHPNGPRVLSRHDKKVLSNLHEGHLAMLVEVERILPSQKNKKWKNNHRDVSICGPIAEKYFLRIFSFVHDKKKDKVIKLRTQSSSITTFNKKIKKYKEVQLKLKEVERKMKRTLKKVERLKRVKQTL